MYNDQLVYMVIISAYFGISLWTEKVALNIKDTTACYHSVKQKSLPQNNLWFKTSNDFPIPRGMRQKQLLFLENVNLRIFLKIPLNFKKFRTMMLYLHSEECERWRTRQELVSIILQFSKFKVLEKEGWLSATRSDWPLFLLKKIVCLYHI